MATIDPRIDEYIAKAAEFAQPILRHIRETVHAACPDVVETIKWGMPHFDYKGILCGMASFKAHASLGFWKGSLILGDAAADEQAMGQFGRITSIKDLPSKKVLTGYIKHAMKLNDEGVKVPARAKPAAPKTVVVPDYVKKALAANAAAKKHFATFPPSAQREYIEWFEDAKTETTRVRRLAQGIEWIAEGKRRNWKYENC
jgi:uncharacterized protein YdeI (YjbR/CyaY-like superfamily)